MKPYNERLAMIDEAVERNCGEWPFSEGIHAYLSTTGSLIGTSFIDDDFESDNNYQYVSSAAEFEQRAKELGWINSYKYGVEYETNGEKPDLPDDVLVELLYRDGDKGETACLSILRWDHIGKDGDILSFRIVDSRYKPKGEPVGEIPASVLERVYRLRTKVEENQIIEDSQKEQEMNNDWYEKGELPPVGSVVRHKESGKDVEVKCHLRTGQAIGERLCHPLIEIGFASDFEPLRTETDKLVDQAMSLFSKTEATMDAKQGIEHAVRKLINAGYRKIEPISEDEFVDKVESLYGVRDLLVKELYRAGCRFLDQGE